MFQDISHFNNTKDYLPIITAILIVEIITIILSFTHITTGNFLRVWYKKYQLSAVLADVSLIFLGIVIARAIYPYLFDTFSLLYFIILVVVIQILHDIVFYIIIRQIPKGVNRIIDILKDYADEISYYAIIGDSLMMIASVLIAGFLANFDANTNIIILAFLIYILQFILYTY